MNLDIYYYIPLAISISDIESLIVLSITSSLEESYLLGYPQWNTNNLLVILDLCLSIIDLSLSTILSIRYGYIY